MPDVEAASGNAGHRIYTPLFLRVYDPVVLGVYSRVVWRCPAPRLVELYNGNLGRRHLDVGPGTGSFLAAARLPAAFELTLLDPNAAVLAFASRRLAGLRPAAVHADVVQADVRAPLPVAGPFDSAALSYVLHCLPGPPAAKAAAVRNVAGVLTADGVLFGATILGEPDRHTALGRAALAGLNRRGIFDNRADTLQALQAMLDAAFRDVAVEVVGAAAVFTARSPRRLATSAAPAP